MRFQQYELTDIRMFHSTVPAGHRSFTEHHHTECELSMFLSGSGIYTVGEKRYSFQTGDVFLFGSNEPHCITDIFSDVPFDLVNIQFEPKLLWDSGDEATRPLLHLFSDRNERFSNRIDRDHASTAIIRQSISEIEKEFCEKRPGYALQIKVILYSVLLHLLRDYGYVRENTGTPSNDHVFKQLAKAVRYINDHLGDALTLEEIARQSAMSKTYFTTIFKKYNGIPLWDYITIKRVEKAVVLLKETDKTKPEIAALCGFTSVANFYRAFARVTGKKPGDYTAAKHDAG